MPAQAALVGIALFAFFVNLQTIRTFPSWFDEAYFANVAQNLALGQNMVGDLVPGFHVGEVRLYGPVFFHLQAMLIQLFGLDAFYFRLPGLMAAYMALAFIALFLRNSGLRPKYLGIFGVAAIVDVSFNRNLVSGRMDMLALLLVTVAMWLASCSPQSKPRPDLLRWGAVGLTSAFAFLTTPRALFLLPIVLFLWLRHVTRPTMAKPAKHDAPLTLVVLLTFVLPVAAWVRYVGGPTAYFDQFASNDVVGAHIAPSLFRSAYDNIAIALLLFLVTLNVKTVLRSWVLAGLFATFLAFSVFVREHGPYAGMIMPFVIAAIVFLLARSNYQSIIKVALIASLTVPGSVLVTLRAADLALNGKCRDGEGVMRAIAGRVGDAATIIAPFKYYFLLEGKDRKLLTVEYAKGDPSTIRRGAELVVADWGAAGALRKEGFVEAGGFACAVRRVPLLPETFYQRSVFQEALFIVAPRDPL